MRWFALLNFQHLIAALFPTLLFMVIFGVGLAFMHLKTKDSDARQTAITGQFADDIRERNAPFPLIMILTVAGTFLWGFFYIVMHGLLGVKI